MSYTIHLFAHDGAAFASRLRSSWNDILKQVERWAKSQRIRGPALDTGLKRVKKVLGGNFCKPSPASDFDALCSIGDATMERIMLPELTALKHFSDMQAYGVIPGLLCHPALYPLAKPKEIPPAADFVPWTAMNGFPFQGMTAKQRAAMKQIQGQVDEIFSQLGRLITGKAVCPPRSFSLSQEQVNFARQQFTDVLETLVEDKLDLLAVIE